METTINDLILISLIELGMDKKEALMLEFDNTLFTLDLVKEVAKRSTKHFETMIEDVTAENEQYSRDYKKVINLLNRASALVGNKGTGQSATIDIACDEWQLDYKNINK